MLIFTACYVFAACFLIGACIAEDSSKMGAALVIGLCWPVSISIMLGHWAYLRLK